jgi:hypothetical protein
VIENLPALVDNELTWRIRPPIRCRVGLANPVIWSFARTATDHTNPGAHAGAPAGRRLTVAANVLLDQPDRVVSLDGATDGANCETPAGRRSAAVLESHGLARSAQEIQARERPSGIGSSASPDESALLLRPLPRASGNDLVVDPTGPSRVTCSPPRATAFNRDWDYFGGRAARSGNDLSVRLDSSNGLKVTRQGFASATGSTFSNKIHRIQTHFPSRRVPSRYGNFQGKWENGFPA